ncbi:hypothetical protein RyT2_15690 [Pseudolactococcus yaeyamensis]
MKDVIQYIREQIKYLPLIIRMSKYNTKNNYQNFILGRIWQYANPIIMATFYYVIFGYIFKRSLGATNVPYLPWMLVGMAIWGFTNGTILQSLYSIIGQLNLSNTFRFPVSISPTITFVGNIIEALVILFFAAVMGIYNGYTPSLYWFQMIYYFFAIIGIVAGVFIGNFWSGKEEVTVASQKFALTDGIYETDKLKWDISKDKLTVNDKNLYKILTNEEVNGTKIFTFEREDNQEIKTAIVKEENGKILITYTPAKKDSKANYEFVKNRN